MVEDFIENDLEGKHVQDLFPDLTLEKKQETKSRRLEPPPPPDTSWIKEPDLDSDSDSADELVSALTAFSHESNSDLAGKCIVQLGYRVDRAESAAEALTRLESSNYQLVICSTEIPSFNSLHEYLCRLSPARRRHMIYALVGPDLHTLYDLEALSLSANVVINSKHLIHLKKILVKVLRDHETLFGPFLAAIRSKTNSLIG